MKSKHFFCKLRSPGRLLPGFLVLLLLLTFSACGSKSSVQIYDNARVLNSSKVQNAASNLSQPVAIYTTNTFQGTESDFQRTAIQKLNGDPNKIVMAIDTNSRYIYIARGSQVPLSSTSINRAVSSFAGRFNNGDYTNASVAALNSMRSSINASNPNAGASSFSPAIPCLLIPLVLILGAVLLAASRRARMGGMGLANRGGGGMWGTRNPQDHEREYYGPNQGPNRGYGPQQGYGPDQGYGPQNRRGGVNPWMAGGLGAAAGGLAGYELGRRAGEQQPNNNPDQGGDLGGGGNFGPASDPDSGDYGAGGSFGNQDPAAFGGGGNFGGGFGGSNLFGGGGDFGGGNSSEDFGGGGGFGGGGFGSGNDDSGGGGNF